MFRVGGKGRHFALGSFLEFDTEPNEYNKTQSSCDRIDRARHGECIIDTMCHDGCQQDLDGIERRLFDKWYLV